MVIKSNNFPILILLLFLGPLYYSNVLIVRFGIIILRPCALGRSGLQLRHTSISTVPQPPGVILGVGFQMDMIS